MKTTTERAIKAAMDGYQRDIATAARNNAARAHIAGDLAAHKALGMDISFNLVQKEALEYSRGYGELLYREGASIIQGEKVPWLQNHKGKTREKVFKTIRDGLKEGKPVSEIGGKKLGKGTIAYDLKKIMGMEDSGMVRIARTEVARIQSAGSMTRYMANNIKKLKWLCGGDPCPICAKYCNKIFDINDMPEIPVHPNCTCDKAPIISREKREEIRRKKPAVEKPKPKPKKKVPKKVKEPKEEAPKEISTTKTSKEQIKEDKKIAKELYAPTKKTGKEHGFVIDNYGNKYYAVGDKSSIRLKEVDAFNTKYHTHPGGKGGVPEGFSGADVNNFIFTNQTRRTVVITDKNIHVLTKTDKTPSFFTLDEKIVFSQRFKNTRIAKLQTYSSAEQKKISSYTASLQHANREIAKKYNCIYEIIPR